MPDPRLIELLSRPSRVHAIGAGGIGMAGLATLLAAAVQTRFGVSLSPEVRFWPP